MKGRERKVDFLVVHLKANEITGPSRFYVITLFPLFLPLSLHLPLRASRHFLPSLLEISLQEQHFYLNRLSDLL